MCTYVDTMRLVVEYLQSIERRFLSVAIREVSWSMLVLDSLTDSLSELPG